MKTLDTVFGKKTMVDAFDLFRVHTLTDVEMNYIRGGGDPPEDDEPIDIIFPFPYRP